MRVVLPLVLLLPLLACSDASERAASPSVRLAPTRLSPPQVEGAESCAPCHAGHVERWSQSPMARTLERTSPPELDGLGPVYDESAGYSYSFARTPDGRSHVLGEGRPDTAQYAYGVEVLFGVGSGTRDRSYVVGRGTGMWFAPVEVIPRPGGRQAVLAPHASMQPGSRFNSPITPECLGCHTDHPPPRNFPLNLRPSLADWQPRGISCGACHGGAQQHAVWQLADERGDALAGPDPLLRNETLSRVQRISICAACHLQGDARIVLDGHSLGPPAPGSDLLQERALFVAREATADVGFVSQVERLLLSRCFRETQMTCSTCHDPHGNLGDESERARVRAACTTCHPGEAASTKGRLSPARSASAAACSRKRRGGIETHQVPQYAQEQDCVDCHMPLSGVFDVARVSVHDHYVRRDTSDVQGPSAEGSLRFPESASGDWKRFRWPWVSAPPTHMDEPGLWMMAYVAGGHLEQASALLDNAPGETSAQIPMYHHVRAGLLESLGRQEEARQAYGRALELDPELAVSAINLGLLLGQAGQVEAGLDLLDSVLERFPMASSALRNRAVLHGLAGQRAAARSDLERAFECLPNAQVALALASLWAASGDPVAEARWRDLARQLDPHEAIR